MENINVLEANVAYSYAQGMAKFSDRAIVLTQGESDELQKITEVLLQKMGEISTKKRAGYIAQMDEELKSLAVESTSLKATIEQEREITSFIKLLASAVKLAVEVVKIITPGIAKEAKLFGLADQSFHSSNAERDFLRCMVSYLIGNPIGKDDWLFCKDRLSSEGIEHEFFPDEENNDELEVIIKE